MGVESCPDCGTDGTSCPGTVRTAKNCEWFSSNFSEPLTTSQEAMAQLRELYVSMLTAGFSQFEAGIIVGTVLAQVSTQQEGKE